MRPKPVENVVCLKERHQAALTRHMCTTTRNTRSAAKKIQPVSRSFATQWNILEFEGEITNGDPIMLICEFTIEDPEARAAKAKDAKDKLAALESGEWDGSEEQSDDETVVESPDILGDLLDDD